MSGYFSRLIQQTEINVGRDDISSRASVNYPHFSFAENEDALSTSLSKAALDIANESVTVEIEHDQKNDEKRLINKESNLSPVKPAFQPSLIDAAPKQEPFNDRDKPLETQESQFSTSVSEPQADILDLTKKSPSEKAPQLKDEIATSSLIRIISTEDPAASSLARSASKNKLENTVYRLPNIEKNIPVSPQIPLEKLPKILSQDSPAPFPEQDNQPTTIPQASHPFATRPINLQTVREWVAETPDKKSNSQFPILHSQPQTTQNIVLSIGTISLTIEASQPEVPKSPPPPIELQQEIPPANPTSRLNRHYIRFR